MDDTSLTPLPTRLVQAGWIFGAGSAIHLADHLRRGQGSVTEELFLLGNIGLVLQIIVIVLLVTRHTTGPRWALVGYPLAFGFLAAHWLPEWSPLSDPIWEVESLQGLSWFASTTEIIGALAVAILATQWLQTGKHANVA